MMNYEKVKKYVELYEDLDPEISYTIDIIVTAIYPDYCYASSDYEIENGNFHITIMEESSCGCCSHEYHDNISLSPEELCHPNVAISRIRSEKKKK